MSGNQYFIVNEWVEFNHNAIIEQAPMVAYNVDYKLTLNDVNLNAVFPITFQQNATNTDAFDVTLTRTTNSNAAMLAVLDDATATWTGVTNGVAVSSGIQAQSSLSQKILELVALRVFGHASARAAIVNDSTFEAKVLELLPNRIYSALNNHRNELFGRYVELDRIDPADDVTSAQNMNLESFNMSFLLAVTGSILSDEAGNPVLTGLGISDGYDGYATSNAPVFSTMVNGAYNIPVLVSIHSSGPVIA